jgi:hypothetical protein
MNNGRRNNTEGAALDFKEDDPYHTKQARSLTPPKSQAETFKTP